MRRLIAAIRLRLPCPWALPPSFSRRSARWAQREIKLVTAEGLMGGDAARFRPDAPLTKQALADLVDELTEMPAAQPTAPTAHATLAELDQGLVRGARALRRGSTLLPRRPRNRSQATGPLRQRSRGPPDRPSEEPRGAERRPGASSRRRCDSRRGRLLGRADPPLLRLGDRVGRGVRGRVRASRLHSLAAQGPPDRVQPDRISVRLGRDEQRRAVAVRRPFEGRVRLLGVRCGASTSSSPTPGGTRLNATLRGRTAAQMAAEAPKSRRIAFANLQPGDLLFFGRGGRRARAASVDHMGIYAGNGWMIHSSRYGVALARVEGWYQERFAWGRRPLAEAGLTCRVRRSRRCAFRPEIPPKSE